MGGGCAPLDFRLDSKGKHHHYPKEHTMTSTAAKPTTVHKDRTTTSGYGDLKAYRTICTCGWSTRCHSAELAAERFTAHSEYEAHMVEVRKLRKSARDKVLAAS